MDSRRFAAVVQAGATAPPTSLEFWMDHLQIEANRGKKKKGIEGGGGGCGGARSAERRKLAVA